MAEVAGLVLGAVGLAGVVGAFKDVVDLYSLFVDSKHLGKDYEILDTKLDIEKTMLLHWANRVRLLQPDYDTRLDDLNTGDTVFRVLASIRSLLSNASELKTRYGVRTLPDSTLLNSGDSTIAAPENTGRAISGRQMERLTRDFDKMRLRMQIPEHSSLKNKFRWAVRDKKDFETLLQHLSHFTTKLDDLIPATVPSPILTQTDLQSIRELQGLKMVLEASLGLGRSAIAGAVEQAIEEETRQQRILSMLWFRTMNAREAGIAPAHAETMDWALQPPRDGDKWDDLSAWLRSGEGIYWVSGKAGSGKSTLMKRLVQRLRTEQLLFEWANGGPYSLVNFFFWYHGTPEQQSQEGLSRSLLHQILSRHPAAIPDVLPGMWKELERNPDGQVSFPSPTETRDAFQTLASKASQFGKFCVFIDGLDEFTGDYRDAIAFIKDLTTNPCFKVVVSSRPIPECNAGFEDCPGLRLQDLTRPDIAKYVDDVVGGHKSMQKLVTRHPVQAQQLKDELVDKSSGVFLWVVLACRSLLSGFAHGDQLADLQHRVAELPPELGDMFSLMVSRVNKRYREQGAFMLRVSYAFSSVSSTAKLRTFITEQPMTLGLALLAQDGGFQHDADNACHRRSVREQRELCEDFVGWMTSRCGGLLEVQLGEYSGPGQICLCGRTQLHDPWIDSSVRWMHRTVFEFLQDGKVWDYEFLQCHESRPSNSGALSLYGLYLGIHMPPEFGVEIPTPPKVGVGIHMLPKFGVGTSASLHPHWASHMIFSGMLAARADAEDPCDVTPGLAFTGLYQDLLTVQRVIGANNVGVNLHQYPNNGVSLGALILAAQFGALNYLKACLQPGGLNPAGASTEALSTLLAHAVVRPLLFSSELDLNKMVPPSIPVISWLLASGANPNTPAANGEDVGDIKTHWVSWLKMVDNNNRGLRGKPEMSNAAEVTVMLLAAGADPKLVDELPSRIRRFILRMANKERLTVPSKDVLRAVEIIRCGRGTPPTGSNINPASSDCRMSRVDQRANNGDKPGTIFMADTSGPQPDAASDLTRPQKRGRSVSPGEGEANLPSKRLNNGHEYQRQAEPHPQTVIPTTTTTSRRKLVWPGPAGAQKLPPTRM